MVAEIRWDGLLNLDAPKDVDGLRFRRESMKPAPVITMDTVMRVSAGFGTPKFEVNNPVILLMRGVVEEGGVVDLPCGDWLNAVIA